MIALTPTYKGRFAPSPTGSLHLGSLVAAMASYLQARQQNGDWLVRIEDVDEARTVTGAADDILHTLDGFGFEWQGSVIYQSQQKARYADLIEQLLKQQQAYPCTCSRKQIARTAELGNEGYIYPETCRHQTPITNRPHSIRLRTNNETISFTDQVYGYQQQDINTESGDFIIRRSDGFTAYQLAVVADDAAQGINHVVRGADLLSSTPRQIYLQQLLGFKAPEYAHIPLMKDAQGKKLCKQYHAQPVTLHNALESLQVGWDFLQQDKMPQTGNVQEFWALAVESWDIRKIGVS